MTWTVGLVFGITMVVGGGALRYFLWYLRSVQIICHLPMLKTVVPVNVVHFFRVMIPLLTFDILDPEWTTELFLDFDDNWQED